MNPPKLRKLSLVSDAGEVCSVTVHESGRTSVSKTGLPGLHAWLELTLEGEHGLSTVNEKQLLGIDRLGYFGDEAVEIRVSDRGAVRMKKHRMKKTPPSWRIAYSLKIAGDAIFRLSGADFAVPVTLQ